MFWDAPHQHHVRHGLNYTQAVDPASNTDCQAFARELVDQRHKTNLAAIMRLGFDKIVRPDVVIGLRSRAYSASSHALLDVDQAVRGWV
jgi:hypothetical protein